MMQEYLSYYGYDVKTLDDLPWYKYENYLYMAKDLNMKPYEIRDMGDYIFVYFGDSKWWVRKTDVVLHFFVIFIITDYYHCEI